MSQAYFWTEIHESIRLFHSTANIPKCLSSNRIWP